MERELDEYELMDEPGLRERIMFFLWRAMPYALAALAQAALVWFFCSIAARHDTRAAADQWLNTIESARRELKKSGTP